MSEDGFAIDTGPVREACERLGSLSPDFEEVFRYAAEADPESWMWGAPGAAFAMQYEVTANSLRVLMGMLAPAVEGVAVRIGRACDDYGDTDDRAAGEIEDRGEGADGVR
ncbi:hypothetical protein [Glycomyces tenuis]|uniref:hypothetical protein n=1 Tax=Glycomyces tenuis TaxID=58116 RepID=UPI0004283D2F|nr:hypothetical protein [Glycomyces tenuis]